MSASRVPFLSICFTRRLPCTWLEPSARACRWAGVEFGVPLEMSAVRRTGVIRRLDNNETSSSPPSKGSIQASRPGLEDKVVHPGHGLVAARVAKASPPLKAPLPASPFVASAPPVAACDGSPTTRASPQLSLGSTVSPGHGVLAAASTSPPAECPSQLASQLTKTASPTSPQRDSQPTALGRRLRVQGW